MAGCDIMSDTLCLQRVQPGRDARGDGVAWRALPAGERVTVPAGRGRFTLSRLPAAELPVVEGVVAPAGKRNGSRRRSGVRPAGFAGQAPGGGFRGGSLLPWSPWSGLPPAWGGPPGCGACPCGARCAPRSCGAMRSGGGACSRGAARSRGAACSGGAACSRGAACSYGAACSRGTARARSSPRDCGASATGRRSFRIGPGRV
jgi:hypothetical protein